VQLRHYPEGYKRIIAIIERSDGNDTIGDTWLETRSFDKDTPISEIVTWARNQGVSGKLIITIDEDSCPGKDLPF